MKATNVTLDYGWAVRCGYVRCPRCLKVQRVTSRCDHCWAWLEVDPEGPAEVVRVRP